MGWEWVSLPIPIASCPGYAQGDEGGDEVGLWGVVDADHADGLCASDVVGEVVYEEGFVGLAAQTGEGGLVELGVGFHDVFFGGDDDGVEGVGDGELVGEGVAQVVEGVADKAGLVGLAQAADAGDHFPVELIAGPEVVF